MRLVQHYFWCLGDLDFEPVGSLVPLLLVCIIAFVVYHLASRSSWNVRIVVAKGEISIDGAQVAAAKAALIRSFWMKQLADVSDARVLGYWNGRHLKMQCSGQLSAGQKQRIRNYLLTIL